MIALVSGARFSTRVISRASALRSRLANSSKRCSSRELTGRVVVECRELSGARTDIDYRDSIIAALVEDKQRFMPRRRRRCVRGGGALVWWLDEAPGRLH